MEIDFPKRVIDFPNSKSKWKTEKFSGSAFPITCFQRNDRRSFYNVFELSRTSNKFESGGICNISTELLPVAKKQSLTTLYRVYVNKCKEELNVVEYTYHKLWPTTLGYLSDKGLNTLTKKMFLSLKSTPLKTCIHYFSYKLHKISFHSNDPHMRQNILNGKSLGGVSYFCHFY